MNHIDLVAVNIRSALNVGSLFRSADAFGINKVWLAGYSATPEHVMVRKTALGAEKTVEWEKAADPIECLERLKTEGVRLIGLERTHGARDLASYAASFPCAIVVGNEVEGLSKMQMDCCDDIVEIVQTGTKESLNVAVAAGIAMHIFRTSLCRASDVGKNDATHSSSRPHAGGTPQGRLPTQLRNGHVKTLHHHPNPERGKGASQHV